MNSTQVSRRNFLSNMAVLTTGALLAPAVNLIASPLGPTNLQQLWETFYQQGGGQLFKGSFTPAETAAITPAIGHHHQTGEMVYFPEANLLAQPTWIYWKEMGSPPADVVITFFAQDEQVKKLFRINRFELEGLLALPAETGKGKLLSVLKKEAKLGLRLDKTKKQLQISTRVRKGRDVQVCTSFHQQQVTIKKNLIYHV